MKEIIRYCVGIGFIIIVLYSYDARPSGFFPYPLYTNDPAGAIDPQDFYNIGCSLAEAPESLNSQLVSIYVDGFVYYYDLFDVIDMCIVLRSIGDSADTD